MNLVEALQADGASVAVVGAGGKKTTMYALARRLDRSVVTATVRIPIFDNEVATVATTATPLATLEAADDDFPLGLVPEREREDRYLGYDVDVVEDLIDAHDGSVLVKADGARMRDLKAPKEAEPQLPGNVDVVVPIASVHAVGEPLDDALVHRPERVAAAAREAGVDVAVGDGITPELVGAILASPHGGLKDVPAGATVIPLLNKVDDGAHEATARAVAAAFRTAFARRRERGEPVPEVPRVVLARLIDGVVVETVDV